MLSDDVNRYISLRRVLGYKLVKVERSLRAFAFFAIGRGDTHIRAASVLAWLETVACTPGARARRLTDLILFARFLHAEDSHHEIPQADSTRSQQKRPVPYIYTPDEIARILDTAGKVRRHKSDLLRRPLYVMLFGLIAAAGLRVSEALTLRFDDIQPGGVLHIRETKFRKSRLVPLHATVIAVLEHYLRLRRRCAGESEWLFPSIQDKQLCPTTVNYAFRSVLRRAGIAPERSRQPRVHDLRHTFATRVLEQCGVERGTVARHFVALSTYLGHSDIRNTYWYLEATPQMMADIAAAAEMLVGESVA
ncbi:tyrosine-type recombinase/integrase [Xanthobacter flavus]|uniref:tyrosine-type recombinase/integrase n=1 Tax=Xanthobacter flavus TaxID=281 RepID=UPI00372AED62